MSLPRETKTSNSTVCKLNKSIYGLKKTPKRWNRKFDFLMSEVGFVLSENDFCLY